MFGGFLTNTKSKEGLMNQEGDPEEETKDINEVELQVTNFNKKQLKKQESTQEFIDSIGGRRQSFKGQRSKPVDQKKEEEKTEK